MNKDIQITDQTKPLFRSKIENSFLHIRVGDIILGKPGGSEDDAEKGIVYYNKALKELRYFLLMKSSLSLRQQKK